MKIPYFLTTTALFLALVSCQSELDQAQIQDENSSISHHIPEQIALESLQSYIDADIIPNRSNSSKRTIENVYSVSIKPITRSSSLSTIENGEILYVANFQNDEGYAILAADDRISENIIAITDEGSMSDVDISTTMDELAQNYFIGYPLNGAGVFTSPLFPGEELLNPNTFNFIDIEKCDTMIGTLDDDYLIRKNNQASNNSDLSLAISTRYAISQVEYFNEYTQRFDSNPFPLAETTNVTTSTKLVKEVKPMLGNYTYWAQKESPFNDECDSKFVGCVPLSLGKILAKLKHPSSLYINNEKFDWNLIQTGVKYDDAKREAIAKFLHFIGKECKTKYFANGSFTFPFRAKNFLKSYGYKNVDKCHYNSEKVITMLDNGNPVIVFAIPHILKIGKSHAWNIDGYKTTQITKKYTKVVGGKEISSKYETCNKTMVHCDFGWKGTSNGYYASGVFRLDDQEAQIDPGYKRSEHSYDFSTYLRIIFYSL